MVEFFFGHLDPASRGVVYNSFILFETVKDHKVVEIPVNNARESTVLSQGIESVPLFVKSREFSVVSFDFISGIKIFLTD